MADKNSILKYETLDFGHYKKLKKIFLQKDFDHKKTKELDLQNQNAPQLPPKIILDLTRNLIILNISNNNIDRFEPKHITNYIPKLEQLKIQNNQIKTLEDLIELGNLQHLWLLDFKNNPIEKVLERQILVQRLLNPEKYQEYNPVRLLLAVYDEWMRKNPTIGPKEYEKVKQNQEKLNQLEQEEVQETNFSQNKFITKYNNREEKKNQQACPTPRKTRFPNLINLNQQILTIGELLQAFKINDIQLLIPSKEENEISQNLYQKSLKGKELHKQYLKQYIKKIKRIKDLKRKEFDEDEIQYNLYANLKKISLKKFEPNTWSKPKDLKYKNAQYNISVENLNKQLKQEVLRKKAIEEKQKHKIQKRRLKNHKKICNKLLKENIVVEPIQKIGFQELSDDSGIESDMEIQRIFKQKVKTQKPHLQLSEESSINTSVYSFLSEDLNKSELNDEKNSSLENQSQLSINSIENQKIFQKKQELRMEKLNQAENLENFNIKILENLEIQDDDQKRGQNQNLQNSQQNTPNSISNINMVQNQNLNLNSFSQKNQQFLFSRNSQLSSQLTVFQKSKKFSEHLIETPVSNYSKHQSQQNNVNSIRQSRIQGQILLQDKKYSQSQIQNQNKEQNKNFLDFDKNKNGNNIQQQKGNQKAQKIIDKMETKESAIFQSQFLNKQLSKPLSCESQGNMIRPNKIISRKNSAKSTRNFKLVSEHLSANQTTAHPSLQNSYYQKQSEKNHQEQQLQGKLQEHKDFLENQIQKENKKKENFNNDKVTCLQMDSKSFESLYEDNEKQSLENYSQFQIVNEVEKNQGQIGKNLGKYEITFNQNRDNLTSFLKQKVDLQRQYNLKAKGIKNKIFMYRKPVEKKEIDRLKQLNQPNYKKQIKKSKGTSLEPVDFKLFQGIDLAVSPSNREKNCEFQESQQNFRKSKQFSKSQHSFFNQNSFMLKNQQQQFLGQISDQQERKMQIQGQNKNKNLNQDEVIFPRGYKKQQKLQYWLEEKKQEKIELGDLLPTEQMGFLKKYRDQIIFDPASVDQKELKKFREIIEKSEELKQQCKQIMQQPQDTKLNNTITFNKMVEYLLTDKNFKVQNSYFPAENIIYKTTRNKKKFPIQYYSAKDLSDLQQKINNFNTSDYPKLTFKDIQDKLNDPKMKIKDQLQLFDELEVLENIKIKETKITQAHINRIEQKEVERAEHQAHLAYHYFKLKRHIEDEKRPLANQVLKREAKQVVKEDNSGQIQFKSREKRENQHVLPVQSQFSHVDLRVFEPKSKLQVEEHRKGIYRKYFYEPESKFSLNQNQNLNLNQNQKLCLQLDEGFQKEGGKGGMVENQKENFNFQKQRESFSLRIGRSFSKNYQIEGNSELKQRNQADQCQSQNQSQSQDFINNFQYLKSQYMQKDQEVKVAVNGFQQKQNSDKNKKAEKICIKTQELNKELQSGKLVDWQNIYHPSFEEQLHNNIKQMDYGILKNQDPTLAQEQKMMKYAQEFKKTLEQRQILKQKIEKNVQQGGKKLDEFFEWEEKEQENRLDQHQIFLDYAKKVQNNQINSNPLKNIPSYNRQNL